MHANTLKPFVFMISIIALVSLACMGFGASPSPEPPPPPVEPPAPAEPAQPEPTEPPQPASQKFFTEGFDAGNDNWSYFISKNNSSADDSDAIPFTEDGFLIFDLNDWLNVYAIYEPHTYDNVRIYVRVENRGVNSNNVNIICRLSDEGWYEISLANNGLYNLWAYDGAKNSYNRIADGGSTKIKPGKEINEYTFVCNDRDLIVYVNGNETRKYTDNKYVFKSGQIGVGASAGIDKQTGNDLPVKLEFDFVEISEP